MKRTGYGKAATLVLLFSAGFCLLVLPLHPVTLIPVGQPWTHSGGFYRNGAYVSTGFSKDISAGERQGLEYWGSWSGSDANTGRLESPVFRAPAIMECLLAGYPGKPGMDIFLERQSDHLRIPLSLAGYPPAGETWRRYTWYVPDPAKGKNVRLIAVDNATEPGGWVGVSTPVAYTYAQLFWRQLPAALITLGCFLLDFALFLLPGFALASVIVLRWPLNIKHALVITIAASSTLGYFCFWMFFLSKPGGKLYCLAVYLAALAALFYAGRRRTVLKSIRLQAAEPLLISAAAGLCYLCFFFLPVNPLLTDSAYVGSRFFDQMRPGDNQIPLIFARRIYDRQPVRPFCCGDWLSSDRPPLQSGIFLLERPLPPIKNSDLNYELLTTGLQCLWICGVWQLLQLLGTPVVQIRRALLLLIFSGFLFYNSVYKWPKLLAATFILFAIGIFLRVIRTKRSITYSDSSIAATCVGLALSAHPGSVFSLAAIGVILVRYHALFPYRKGLLALTIVLAFVLPWSAYQKFVDPPGNRLLKMHLAGEQTIDQRSVVQTLHAAYKANSWQRILLFKWSNIRLLWGHKLLDEFGWDSLNLQGGLHIDQLTTENSRIAQREWIWNAVGVLNIGWVTALFSWYRKASKVSIPYRGWLIAIALGNFVFWSVITFGPNETVTTHSSYADILLLSVGLLGFILELPGPAVLSVAGFQIFNFAVVWLWSVALTPEPIVIRALGAGLQLPLLVFGSLFAIGLTSYLGLIGGRQPMPEVPPLKVAAAQAYSSGA